MLLRALEWIEGQDATLAILCKVAVARKVRLHAWKHGHRCCGAEVHRILALEHFGASVDACLFVVSGHPHRDRVLGVRLGRASIPHILLWFS